MAIEKRSPASTSDSKYTLGSGPYLAKVVSHLDPSFMGSLEVTLLKQQGNVIGDVNQTYIVRAAPPFYGSTAFEFMGSNEGNFDDTQKSYGMWFVPPDIGITVIVIFIDSNPAEGYWIGCVPSRFANNMVPGIAATDKYVKSELSTVLGDPRIMPVAEINRRLNDTEQNNNVDDVRKAIHPIAGNFAKQGLLKDEVRGTTTSSARRDIPSMVFGISTPGPLDKRPGAKRAQIGTRQSLSPNPVPVSRLGGTQFIMDDGNDQFQRKTPAGGEDGGPPEYADVLEGEEGEVTIPKDEMFRIRTRTGHQILMHNSEDLIYIGNARGTSWVELSSDGKIDIFADDSISIHTKNDLNIRADRDINLEAGRNVNIKATAQYQSPEKLYEEHKIVDEEGYENGRVHIHSQYNFDLYIGANGRIATNIHKKASGETVDGGLDIDVAGYMKLTVGSGDSPHNLDIITSRELFVTTKGDLHVKTDRNTYLQTELSLHVKTTVDNFFTAGRDTNILSSGNHIETATRIDMNGPTAVAAEPAVAGIPADIVTELTTFLNRNTDATLSWKDTEYQTDPIDSILRRIPVHEPWPDHENLDPQAVTKIKTDREE